MQSDRTFKSELVSRSESTPETVATAGAWELWRVEPSLPFEIEYDRAVTFFAVSGHAEITFNDGTLLDVRAGDLVTIRPPLKGVWRVIEPIENRYQYHT
ncbi:cupin domain-containing protein [Mesorhizobium sp. B3-2-1]|uniref:cupin domain-containing protein n=1 Tax=Mesorhizobium sp. B3-2-1 TaxID=2589891 RepID=UPI001125E847|nr:cupin domain-containing protein [Mesorhizobium sp. B3-2-1]TPI27620.1 cupin domain-containing protein [Mesorhizobium sp. B3-2-1]